jgi:outer membrane protein
VKNLTAILFALLFLCVGVLAYFVFSNRNTTTTAQNGKTTEAKIDFDKVDLSKLPEGKIAYVDLDSITLRYDYINDQSKALKGRYDALSSQYEKMAMDFQAEYQKFQESAQAGIAPQSQLEQKQVELQQKNNEIIQKENQIKNLEMEMEKVRIETTKQVYDFIRKYNEKFNYDFILAKNSLFNTLAYSNPKYDITPAIIAGLNEEYRLKKSESKK